MKRITIFLLSFVMVVSFTKCNHQPAQDPNQSNPDTVKNIVITLNYENYRAYGNPEKFQSFCEDSMLVVGDDMFMTSSNAMAHDLYRVSVFPHDYTFRLFGNTAVISYLWTGYDVNNGDTIFH